MKINWFGYRPGRPNASQAILLRIMIIACVITMILPFLWMVSTALKDEKAFQTDPMGWVPVIPSYRPAGLISIDCLRATTEDFEDVLLADFEDVQPAAAPQAAPRAGQGAFALAYDFSDKAAPPAVEVDCPLVRSAVTDRATMISFWLRGDGSAHHLRVSVSGKDFVYHSQGALPITFDGWKEVYCFLRPEAIDPIGQPVLQLHRESGVDEPVPVAAIERITLHLDSVSRAGQVWYRLTDSFRLAWASMPFGRFFLNSLFVAIAVTIGQTLTSSLAAYAFARLEFPGRDKIFLSYLATMMIPGTVLIVPTFLLMRWLDWFDTYWALIVPAMFSAYGTFMLRQFFKTLPRDLEDAARIDGCGKLRVWLHVILPLSRPAMATLATFTFLGSWESFQWPLFATKSMHMRVVQIGLSSFQDKYDVQYNLLMAAALIVMVPTLTVFIFNQRFFTKGIVMSGMKE